MRPGIIQLRTRSTCSVHRFRGVGHRIVGHTQGGPYRCTRGIHGVALLRVALGGEMPRWPVGLPSSCSRIVRS